MYKYKFHFLENKNHEFFKKINSELKAYLLGFITADGSVSGNTLSVFQSIKDKEIINLLQKSINPNSKITKLKARGKSKPQLIFTITSESLIKDLQKLNIVENKTYKNLGIPLIQEKFFKHFIRGYFDGDGTAGIYFYKTKENYNVTLRRVGFVSNSENLLKDIQMILSSKNISFKLFKEKTFFRLMCVDKINIEKFYKYIYTKSNFYFERKKENMKICMLISSEARKLKKSSPCNA